ncbi:wax ester/triacylglycerol synthase family O-acyltransferase [Nocardia fluminea]|uniref:wax ester/triacylglycerol synthase family O-acyltransferase n=1 Tax=Nocardia fluminea TaxID=134984 RepID=UPI00382CEE83
MRDRLSPMDVAFLDVEDSENHAHLFAFLVFDGPAVDIGELGDAVIGHLPEIPRFRQRLAFVPGGLHRPEWVDVTDFQLSDHLEAIEVPPPGDIHALNVLGDELSSEPLDMTKPLWQMRLVTGLADGRFAIAMKLHHSMVDGISIMDVLGTLFSADPERNAPMPRGWNPRPAPGPAALISCGLLDAGADLLAALVWAVRHPRRLGSRGLGIFRTARLLGQSPDTPFNRGRSSGFRHNSWLVVPLSEFKQIKSSFDTTINNVVLAVVAGGLRRFIVHRQERPVPMFAFVPVSVRAPDERGTLGNRIGLTFPRLPVEVDSATGRLEAIGSVAERSSQLRQAIDTTGLLAVGGLTPPWLARWLNRIFQLRSGLFNLTCTNVPGPTVPVFCCGRRLRSLLGSAPLTAQHGLTIAALSYDGTMFISVTADAERVPDSDWLVRHMRAELDELLDAAKERVDAAMD